MIVPATAADQSLLLRVLERNVMENVYLYLDLLNYGVAGRHVQTWISRTGDTVDTVVLRYHDSFQIYSPEVHEIEGIADLVSRHTPTMISATPRLIRILSQLMRDLYYPSYGYVLIQPYSGVICDPQPSLAKEEDIEEIVHLVCSDPDVGGHYDKHGLAEQFKARQSDGTGRHWYIRMHGKIVAHYATYAEGPNIAVMGGLVVSPEYRRRGLGQMLHRYLADKLIMERRLPVLFCRADAVDMYLKLGAVPVSKYGSLKKVKKGEG